jgi:RNA polymerase sigma-70 factor, ECF subfamily
VTLDDQLQVPPEQNVDYIQLDWALKDLASTNLRLGRIVELRYFGGLTIDETAEVLGVAAATVERDWAFARAWLRRHLLGEEAPA